MITKQEWQSIIKLVQKFVRNPEVTVGTVNRRDASRKQVWVAEFGDEPIPVVGYKTEIRYYDQGADGVHRVRNAVSEPLVPEIGDRILITRTGGNRRLPRCVGVIMGEL